MFNQQDSLTKYNRVSNRANFQTNGPSTRAEVRTAAVKPKKGPKSWLAAKPVKYKLGTLD